MKKSSDPKEVLMKKQNHLRILLVLAIFILSALACNLPGMGEPEATQPPAQQQPDQPPAEQGQTPHAPTQNLPRPTREGQSQLPKPSIPVPPAQTTRQPQAQIVAQPTESGGQNPPPAQPEPDNSGGNGEFYIVNDSSSLVICYYYMTFSTDSEWGPDRLGENDVIYAGETYTLTGVPFGTFDAQAIDCDGNLLAEVYGFDFPPNDTFTLFDQ